MSERLNGLRMDEWANQSAPRGKGREGQAPAAAETKGENPPMNDDKRPILPDASRRPKPPVVGVEQVTARCGHTVPFELFEPKKDKFRNDRRKKLTDRDCSACRIKAQAVKEAADQEATRLRRAERAKAPTPPPQDKERLPHGSRFDVAYDAGKEEWSGTLAVPGLAPITASASAVFKLLRRLDDLYRAATAEKPGGGAGVNRDEGGES